MMLNIGKVPLSDACCFSCYNRRDHVTSILVNDEIIIYRNCDKCLLQHMLIITKFKFEDKGFCNFCKEHRDVTCYHDYYCRDCLLKLYSFITDYLEEMVDNA